MSRNGTNGIVKIVAVVLLLALLGTAVALLYRFTNGFNEDFKTFYLEYDGERIFQSTNEMNFTSGNEVTFGVKYTFDLGDKERDYSVKVIPNGDESFEYSADSRKFVWRAGNESADLSTFFKLKKNSASFTLSFPEGMTVESVLQTLHPGQEIEVDAAALKGKPIYRLEVSSYNGEITYTINFSVSGLSVTLDRDYIIFGGTQS